jgi:hypothetical protein
MLENNENPTVDNAEDATLNTETNHTTSINEVVANETKSIDSDDLHASNTQQINEVSTEDIHIETSSIHENTSAIENEYNDETIVIQEAVSSNEPITDTKDVLEVEEVRELEVIHADELKTNNTKTHEALPTVEVETSNIHEEVLAIEDLHPQENYLALTQKELVAKMQEICNHADVFGNKKHVKSIREAYRNHQKDSLETNLAKFKEAGGDPKEFEAPENPLDETFNELQKRFNQKVTDENKRKERELQENLKARLDLIAEVKAIADSGTGAEGLAQIHELQSKWRTLGIVPAANTDTTWKNFNHHINRYFDGIKYLKELRELDFKRNLELKTALCERAEKFIIEPSIKTAIEGIRNLLSEWKEIGQTTRETNDIIWQRFTAAMDHVYARQKEFIDQKREEFDKNLAAKKAIIEKMKPIAEFETDKNNEWKDKSNEAEELMTEWKQTGFASKADNDAIWEEFKALRDKFYSTRDAFYDKIRATYLHNQKAKTELCEQAERLQESTNWKETSNNIKKLQEEWKKIGAVPQKVSEKLWARFRAACDKFFDNMKLHFAEADKVNAENLNAKEELIRKVVAFELLEDNNETIEALKALQAEWIGIGHVPMKEKERINDNYRKAMDAQFDKVRGRMGEQNKNLFRAKYQNVVQSPKGNDRLREDKVRLQEKIKKIQADIAQQENNISFFAKSKNAEVVLKEVKGRIEAAHTEMKKLREQIKMMDALINEQEKPKTESISNEASPNE